MPQQKDKDLLNGYKRPLYILSTRDPPQTKGHIQTESKGLEKDTSCKWRPKKKKKDSYICCLQETHLETRETYRWKVKGWKKIFHANRDQKKAGVAILISDKIDFKTDAVQRDKEGHYIIIKGSTQEEDITIINIYAPNIGALQYVGQMLTSMKGEINNNTKIVGDFNTPLTPMDR